MKRSWSSLLTVSLLSGSFAIVGCGGDTPSNDSCTTPSTGMNAKAVANTLVLPQTRSDYAFDIDGNGSTENQLGNIIGALSTMGDLNPQDSVNKAIAAGGVVLLLDENAADLTNNDCASVTISSATATATPPKYDGSDTFTKDPALSMGGVFKGKFAAGTFTSNSPVTTTDPTTVTVQLPLVAGSDPVKLTVIGARIQFKRSGDGIMSGQINGAITSAAVDKDVIPSVANLLSSNIAKDPNSSTNKQIASIFDNAVDDGSGCKTTKVCGTTQAGAPTCKNPDGTCADACDNVIGICEVKGNNIIKNVLSADVQMFDEAGNYKPNPAKTKKDSLSLGLSFTGVKASF